MKATKAWTVEDWERLSDVGHDALVHSAVSLALRGDLASVSSLVTFCATRATEDRVERERMRLPLKVTWHQWRQGSPQLTSDVDPKAVHEVTVALAQVPALALAVGPEERQSLLDAKMDAKERLSFLLPDHTAAVRRTWTQEEDALLRQVVAQWGHDGQLAGRFFVAASRFVKRPEVVGAFVEAGMADSLLMERFQNHCYTPKDESMGLTALDLMLQGGNTAGIACWLRTLDKPGDVPVPVQSLKSAFMVLAWEGQLQSDLEKAAHKLASYQLPMELLTRRDPGTGIAPREVADGTIELLRELSRIEDLGQQSAWLISVGLLKSHLSEAAGHGKRFDPQFVSDLLHVAAPGHVSLAQVLGGMGGASGLWTADRQEAQDKVKQLLAMAAFTQCAAVLEAASTFTAGCDELHEVLLRQMAVCGQDPDGRRTRMPFDAAGFRACLVALRDARVDLNKVIEVGDVDEPDTKCTFLTMLAARPQQATCEALVIALEEGCQPSSQMPEGVLRPQELLDEPLLSRWMDIERSFVARQQASLLAQELHDLGHGVRP